MKIDIEFKTNDKSKKTEIIILCDNEPSGDKHSCELTGSDYINSFSTQNGVFNKSSKDLNFYYGENLFHIKRESLEDLNDVYKIKKEIIERINLVKNWIKNINEKLKDTEKKISFEIE